jgi:hypothetical protein
LPIVQRITLRVRHSASASTLRVAMKRYAAKVALALVVLAIGTAGCGGGGVDPRAKRIVNAMPGSDWDSFCMNYAFTQTQGWSDDRTFRYFVDGESTYTVTAQRGVSARAIYEALKTRC